MGLDQYGMIGVKTEKREDAVTGKEYTVKMADQEFYWRKHARLQDFMEILWVEKTGKDAVDLNCTDMELDKKDVQRLWEAIQMRFAFNHSEGGFFYGHQIQEEQMYAYLEQDQDFVVAAQTALDDGQKVVYSCWW